MMKYFFRFFGPYDAVGSVAREFDTVQNSLAAAWADFWRHNPNAERVQCFNDPIGWIADDRSYPNPNPKQGND